MTYEEARDMMAKARNGRRKLENNTYLLRYAPADVPGQWENAAAHYAVRLHHTDVVILHPDGSYTLNSGGWRTVTTKDRIRYAPGSVSSDRGAWYYYPKPGNWDLRYPFADGMRVRHDGKVEGAGIDETAVRSRLLKDIRAYVDGFARHVAENGLADPGPGDCWGCLMAPVKDSGSGEPARAPWGQDAVVKPGSDHLMGVSHILEHFRESYYVPSLLWRAVQRRGNPAFCWAMMKQDAERGDTRMLRQDLRAYLKTLMPALVAARLAEAGERRERAA